MPRNRIIRSAWLLLLLASIMLSSCLAVRESAYDPPSKALCLPNFPDKDGWYGGDGAYSIRLDNKRVLWLFGDTFVSDEKGRQDRLNMQVIMGTTLAISTCSAEGEFQIRYLLKKKDGDFISFFDEKEWLWPQDPFIAAHMLYVPLISIKANPELAGPFKFEIAGHKIARIKNFESADPNHWIIDYLDLTPGIPGGVKAFAPAAHVYGAYIYFYPLYSAEEGGLFVLGNILARIPASRLDNPAPAIEYLNKDGQWEKELTPARVKVVLDAAVSEMSVRYHRDDRKWIAVYMSVRNNGDRMLYQTADTPEGPWSESRVLIGSIPEVDRYSPQYDSENFCYAGKEHMEFARGKTMVVTYVCNSNDGFDKNTSFLRKNLFLYRPVVRNPIH